MATKTKEKSKVGETQRQASNSAGPPVGFVKRSAQGNAPWVRKEPGAVVHGEILGRFSRINDPGKFYYQIKLYEECEVQLAGGETAVVEKDTIVNLDENSQLTALKQGMDEGHKVAWVRFEGKERQKTDPSKTYWKIEVYTSDEALPI